MPEKKEASRKEVHIYWQNSSPINRTKYFPHPLLWGFFQLQALGGYWFCFTAITTLMFPSCVGRQKSRYILHFLYSLLITIKNQPQLFLKPSKKSNNLAMATPDTEASSQAPIWISLSCKKCNCGLVF